jgi:hypothetical protein
MTKRRLLVALALSPLIVLQPPVEAAGPKVTICHIPPGNPDNAHEITVSISAVPAHLAHGDDIGACEVEDPG